jgi:hypothetical protein
MLQLALAATALPESPPRPVDPKPKPSAVAAAAKPKPPPEPVPAKPATKAKAPTPPPKPKPEPKVKLDAAAKEAKLAARKAEAKADKAAKEAQLAERKAEAKRLAIEKKFEAALEEIVRPFGRYPAASRHKYPGQILRAVLFLETVEDRERAGALRRELFGEGTTADKAFGLFRELLHGNLESVLELHELLPQARWYEIASEWRRDSSPKHTAAAPRELSAVLHLLSLCSPYVSSTRGKVSLKSIVGAPEELQDRLAALLRGAAASGRNATMLSRFRASMRYAMRTGKFGDSRWVRVLSDLTTSAKERLDMLQYLRYAENKDLVADLAQWSVDAHPADGGIAIAAYDALIRAGRGAAAFTAMMNAEANVPYPERRRVRMHYLRILRYDRYKSSGKRLPMEGAMTYKEECRERQYAAAWAEDLEARMAMGDVHATERDTQDAVEAYRYVFSRTGDRALRWTAWLAWAEHDAHSAWVHRGAFTNLLDGAKGATGGVANAVQLGCAVALAADDIGAARDWTRARFEAAPTGGCADALSPVLAALSWLAGDEAHARDLLEEAGDTIKGQAVDIALGLPKGRVAALGPMSSGITLAITRNMAQRIDRGDCWVHGTRLAVLLLPSYESAERVAATWQQVTTSFPRKADEEMEALQAEATDACLDWVDGRTESSTALKTLLQGAALQLYRGYGRRGRGNATDLFFACLERAAARELPATTVKYSVSYFLKGLKKVKASDETIAAHRRTIAHHYPDLAAGE